MEEPKAKIYSLLKKISTDLVPLVSSFKIEQPKEKSHGDFASNIALVIYRSLSKSEGKFKGTYDLAGYLVRKINDLPFNERSMFEKIEAVHPGFINFYLSKEYLLSQLKKVLEQKDQFGSKLCDPNKKVIVEYSSPNIAKPFTVGHLRSTIIGDAIANLLAANGWKVFRDNHLGDWGTQFGKQIYAIKTWGNEEEIEKSENPVKELVDLYVRFHEEAEKNPELEDKAREWFKKLEDGDPEARRLWKKCVDWSLKEFTKIYQELNIKFTENNGLGYGEAYFENRLKDVVEELESKKLLKESQGAKLIFFPEDRFPPLMIIKKDGATLYATRDLATDKFRREKYGEDIVIINEVGAEQTLYFKQLFEAEKMLGWFKEGQRIHKRHGHYRFKDEKMSTRKGNTIWLEDVLKMAIEKAGNIAMRVGIDEENKIKATHIVGGQSKREDITQKVAIGALKWNDLKRDSEQDIVFDWDDVLNMQGNSGPYMQYAYVRVQSVWQKSGKQINFKDIPDLNSEELSLLREISMFEAIVENSVATFSPNVVCEYLFDLAQKFNLFYQKHKIIGSDRENFRLALTLGTGQIIKNGLSLLGVTVPEHM
ncbi:MAG: arginine--tRNA ligase [Candidatus Levyibacteriota bacterium]|jgi:arginyl-tRNA synthetase